MICNPSEMGLGLHNKDLWPHTWLILKPNPGPLPPCTVAKCDLGCWFWGEAWALVGLGLGGGLGAGDLGPRGGWRLS